MTYQVPSLGWLNCLFQQGIRMSPETLRTRCVAVCRCCRVLQGSAVCCSVDMSSETLRIGYVAVRCSDVQCVAVCCSVLQCAAVRCSVLQCVAVCCSVLQCVAGCCRVWQCVALCCSVLQCVAVCCSALWTCFPKPSVLGHGRRRSDLK